MNQWTSPSPEGKDDAAKQIEYFRAEDAADYEAIYQLRYNSYVQEGAIDPNEDRRFTDSHDNDANALIFGVELYDCLAASIRLHVCSPSHAISPGLEVFPDVLEPILERGESFIDPTRFVIDRNIRSNANRLPLATVRLAAMAAEHFNADHMLATVRAEHVPFYRRFCHMELRTSPRDYPGLNKPICLMSGDSSAIRNTVYPRYPIFASSHAERVRTFGPSRDFTEGLLGTLPSNSNEVVPRLANHPVASHPRRQQTA
ncbi:N-acyl amino acid synthase FeeM domain-containing protein [Aurantimonas marina]|uniref:N-acyl amino acid synthase FeeM domain-containing protein n=1 Tax=Aurantimonas marina TaxID=2780508 RepID=UPI0019D0C8BD|nr:hypothetical protein [Aurantimonas marina]